MQMLHYFLCGPWRNISALHTTPHSVLPFLSCSPLPGSPRVYSAFSAPMKVYTQFSCLVFFKMHRHLRFCALSEIRVKVIRNIWFHAKRTRNSVKPGTDPRPVMFTGQSHERACWIRVKQWKHFRTLVGMPAHKLGSGSHLGILLYQDRQQHS